MFSDRGIIDGGTKSIACSCINSLLLFTDLIDTVHEFREWVSPEEGHLLAAYALVDESSFSANRLDTIRAKNVVECQRIHLSAKFFFFIFIQRDFADTHVADVVVHLTQIDDPSEINLHFIVKCREDAGFV